MTPEFTIYLLCSLAFSACLYCLVLWWGRYLDRERSPCWDTPFEKRADKRHCKCFPEPCCSCGWPKRIPHHIRKCMP